MKIHHKTHGPCAFWGHLLERRQKDWGTGSTGQRLGGGASNPTSAAVASADEKRQAALEAVQRRQVLRRVVENK